MKPNSRFSELAQSAVRRNGNYVAVVTNKGAKTKRLTFAV